MKNKTKKKIQSLLKLKQKTTNFLVDKAVKSIGKLYKKVEKYAEIPPRKKQKKQKKSTEPIVATET